MGFQNFDKILAPTFCAGKDKSFKRSNNYPQNHDRQPGLGCRGGVYPLPLYSFRF